MTTLEGLIERVAKRYIDINRIDPREALELAAEAVAELQEFLVLPPSEDDMVIPPEVVPEGLIYADSFQLTKLKLMYGSLNTTRTRLIAVRNQYSTTADAVIRNKLEMQFRRILIEYQKYQQEIEQLLEKHRR